MNSMPANKCGGQEGLLVTSGGQCLLTQLTHGAVSHSTPSTIAL